MPTLREVMLQRAQSGEALLERSSPVLIEAAADQEALVHETGEREAPRFMTQRMRAEELEAQEHERTQQLMALQNLVADGSVLYELQKDARNSSPNICLGRAKMNDVVVVDHTISSLHAVIDKRGTRYYLRDQRSKNGTYVNRERLVGTREALLTSGDCVRLGRRVFYYLSGDRLELFLQLRSELAEEAAQEA